MALDENAKNTNHKTDQRRGSELILGKLTL